MDVSENDPMYLLARAQFRQLQTKAEQVTDRESALGFARSFEATLVSLLRLEPLFW